MSYNYEDQLIQVLVEDENGKEMKAVAKILNRIDETTYVVTYLSLTGEVYDDFCAIYDYENKTSIVENDNISIWFDTKTEEKVGFKKMDKNVFITMDDYEDMDVDYAPTDDSLSSEEESLFDSDEYNDSESDSDDENLHKKKNKTA
jgi:hypothetical protein